MLRLMAAKGGVVEIAEKSNYVRQKLDYADSFTMAWHPTRN